MPFRTEFGEPETLGVGHFYYQDLYRMKAVLLNNVSTSYFCRGQIKKAEEFNDQAMTVDPEYSKALLRKCLILERTGQFSIALKIADYAISTLTDEWNFDESSKKCLSDIEIVRKRCLENLPHEKEQ